MRCKCCNEKANFKLIEQGFFRRRFLCSNCNKYFWDKKAWVKGAEGATALYSTGVIVYKVSTGDLPGAAQTFVKKVTGDGSIDA